MAMLLTYADMLAVVKAAIESVSGAGKVLPEILHCHTWTEFLDNFQNADRTVQGWVIYGGPAIPPSGETEGTGIINRITTFTIRGICAVIEDPAPNGNAFRIVCEAVQNALDGIGTATPFPDNKSDHVRMLVFEQRTFGSVLCHYCELVVGIHARYLRQY